MTIYRSVYRTVLLSALVACAGIANRAAAAPTAYHVTDLGTLGGTHSGGLGINVRGQVTGSSNPIGSADYHAFLWTPTTPNGVSGTMLDLGTLGGTGSGGTVINASGQMTGISYTTGDAEQHAFLWTPTTPNGDSGTLNDLGTLGGTYSYGSAINASGQVAGSSNMTEDGDHRAFLWTPTTPNSDSGTLNDLGTLGGTQSGGLGINDSGQVTGWASTIGDAAAQAFLYDPGAPGMNDLGTLGGNYSTGFAINASGQVTGSSSLAGEADSHAFLYDPGAPGMLDLGTLGGTYSEGLGINASGHVTGFSLIDENSTIHAFLYTSGRGMVDLNTLIDPLLGWELSNALGINDAGQITGFGWIGGRQHAFLLNPVPEPASLALLALGLPLIVRLNLRRSGACRLVAASNAISLRSPSPRFGAIGPLID